MLVVDVDVEEVDATAVGAAAATVDEVVTPHSSSTLLPDVLLAASRLRHGGASGFFGFPVAIASEVRLAEPVSGGPVDIRTDAP